MIIDTECVRFTKNGRIFLNILHYQYTSHQNIVYIDDWKGRSPFQPPDSGVSRYRLGAKPLVKIIVKHLFEKLRALFRPQIWGQKFRVIEG